MKKFITLVAVLLLTSLTAMAGESAYRIIIPLTGTNTSYTIGRYEKPTLLRVALVNSYSGGETRAGTNLLVLTYGDAAGGTKTLCTLTNDASGNASVDFVAPYTYCQYGDVLTFGYSYATSGVLRIQAVNRDTKPVN